MKFKGCVEVFAAGLLIFTCQSRAETHLSDDLSTLKNFDNLTIHVAAWESDGANVAYRQNGGGGAARATLISKETFQWSADSSVVLEFTTSLWGIKSKLEVGLIDSNHASAYKNPLAIYGTIYGFSVVHTDSYNKAGLLHNAGTRPAPGTGASAAVPMTEQEGTHTFRIVFKATGTELFRNNQSLGKTDLTLDKSRSYKLVAFGQFSNYMSLDNIILFSE